jgi:peptidoglycan/LPS O-acetylase OafA/YrhL
MSISPEASRMPLIDALRAVASQLIVLHHLAFYGPMSDAVEGLAPAVFAWLSEHARAAVQAFLVCGGFMAARTLAPVGAPECGPPGPLLLRRYLRLAPPLMAAIMLAVVLSALASWLNPNPAIPLAPSPGQLLAHLLLLQDVLGIDALSAGVWYVAIDFQLFALTLGLLWLARGAGSRARPLAISLVAGLGLASLFVFNRLPELDAWAPYFFGAYALGACAWWAGRPGARIHGLAALALAGAAALALDWRLRIAVALAVALVLGIARRTRVLERWPRSALLAWLGRISYSVFLVHFPISIAIGALVWRIFPGQPLANAAGLLAAWAACVAGGALFHRHVELRFTGSGRAASGSAGPAPADLGSGTGSRAHLRPAAPGAAGAGSTPRP